MCKYTTPILITLIFITSTCIASEPVTSNVEMKCGGIYEGEFSKGIEKHEYNINMAPGDKLEISTAPIGAYLGLRIDIYGPSKTPILRQHSMRLVKGASSIATEVLSGRGVYSVYVQNYAYKNKAARTGPRPGSLGVYNLYIKCTLRDGSVIGPGNK